MKVAHLVSTFPPYKGGMGNAAAQFAEIYARHHELTVFTPRHGESIPPEVPSCRVIWLTSYFKYGNAACLPQLLWRLRPFDLIHLHYPFYGAHLPVLIASILWRRKLVLHYHMDSLATGLKGSLFTFNRLVVLPLLLRRADQVIGSSLDYLAHSQLASYFHDNYAKFREVPYWVDSGRFQPGRQESNAQAVVLFVGGLDRAHYFKGLEILLRAMQRVVLNSDRPVMLRVVGSGEMLPYYEKIAAELDLSDRVQFLGKVDDAALVRAYRDASFLVLPSINQGEAFGLVLLEAMSSGKPVIASNLPGVRSVFTDGQEGLVVRAGDVDDLTDKITALVNDETLRAQMGQRARQLVEQKYLSVQAEQKLEAIYRQVTLDCGPQ
jgi:glycosyltransferase involved in cell wall biosynthesis